MTSIAVDGATSPRKAPWRVAVPLATVALIAFLPAPQGLEPHAWYFFAILRMNSSARKFGAHAVMNSELVMHPATNVVHMM